MAGIHRERPGADAIAPCTGDASIDFGDGIWMSAGLSNSYLLSTDDGPVKNSGEILPADQNHCQTASATITDVPPTISRSCF